MSGLFGLAAGSGGISLFMAHKTSGQRKFPSGQTVKGTYVTLELLRVLQNHAARLYRNMVRLPIEKRDEFFDKSVQELKELQDDVNTLKPLYNVVNAAGHEETNLQLVVHKSLTIDRLGQTTVTECKSFSELVEHGEKALVEKKLLRKLGR